MRSLEEWAERIGRIGRELAETRLAVDQAARTLESPVDGVLVPRASNLLASCAAHLGDLDVMAGEAVREIRRASGQPDPDPVPDREAWVRDVADGDLLQFIAAVAARYALDENLGDTTERIQTVQWLATRGAQGRDWGKAGVAAEELGLRRAEA